MERGCVCCEVGIKSSCRQQMTFRRHRVCLCVSQQLTLRHLAPLVTSRPQQFRRWQTAQLIRSAACRPNATAMSSLTSRSVWCSSNNVSSWCSVGFFFWRRERERCGKKRRRVTKVYKSKRKKHKKKLEMEETKKGKCFRMCYVGSYFQTALYFEKLTVAHLVTNRSPHFMKIVRSF